MRACDYVLLLSWRELQTWSIGARVVRLRIVAYQRRLHGLVGDVLLAYRVEGSSNTYININEGKI